MWNDEGRRRWGARGDDGIQAGFEIGVFYTCFAGCFNEAGSSALPFHIFDELKEGVFEGGAVRLVGSFESNLHFDSDELSKVVVTEGINEEVSKLSNL